MQGTHQTEAGSNTHYNKVQLSVQIIKEFLFNEEGFLSSNYTEILKKYYPIRFAERLYVLHGCALSTLAQSVLDDNGLPRTKLRRQRNTWKRLTNSKLFSYAHTSNSNEGPYEVSLRRLLSAYGDSDTVNRFSLAEAVYDEMSAASYDVLRQSVGYLTGSSTGPHLFNGSRELLGILLRVPVGYGSERATEYQSRWAGSKELMPIDRVAISLIGNSFGSVYDDPTLGTTWLKHCRHNEDHLKCLRNFGTASALQAFFHTPAVEGYDGSRILSMLNSSSG